MSGEFRMLKESSLNPIKGKLGLYILEMPPFPESIYRYFPLLLRGEKLVIIQAGSQVAGGYDCELEG